MQVKVKIAELKDNEHSDIKEESSIYIEVPEEMTYREFLSLTDRVHRIADKILSNDTKTSKLRYKHKTHSDTRNKEGQTSSKTHSKNKKSGRTRFFTEEEKKQIKRLRKKGLNYKEIATSMSSDNKKFTYNNIKYILSK